MERNNMVKSEIVNSVVQNYYRDIAEYIIFFQRGDINLEEYQELVEYARAFWLTEV